MTNKTLLEDVILDIQSIINKKKIDFILRPLKRSDNCTLYISKKDLKIPTNNLVPESRQLIPNGRDMKLGDSITEIEYIKMLHNARNNLLDYLTDCLLPSNSNVGIESIWNEIPDSPPYVLTEDKEKVLMYNLTCKNPEFQIKLDLLPEPFIGNIKSKIYLLSLNPGYSEENIEEHKSKPFINTIKCNYLQEIKDFPFYYLNPKLKEFSGSKWWLSKLKSLIKHSSIEQISKSICCLELFPYHSKRYNHNELNLKGSNSSIEIIKKGIEENKLIIIMRSRKLWEKIIPELRQYKRLIVLKNPQNVVISENNMRSEEFKLILKEINNL